MNLLPKILFKMLALPGTVHRFQDPIADEKNGRMILGFEVDGHHKAGPVEVKIVYHPWSGIKVENARAVWYQTYATGRSSLLDLAQE